MSTAVEQTRPKLSHQQILLLMGGLMTGMLLAALDQTIVATALPTVVADLGGAGHQAWVVTSYLLASTVVTGATRIPSPYRYSSQVSASPASSGYAKISGRMIGMPVCVANHI